MLSKDENAELFEMRARGALAMAFHLSDVSPGEEYWPILRGEEEITLRAMGEVGYLTGCNMMIQMVDRPMNEESKDD